MYTIYALFDPRTEVPRYVGRTRFSLNVRLSRHWNSRTRHHCCKEWLLELESHGLVPHVALLEEHDKRDGLEEKWIERFLCGGFELLNKYQIPAFVKGPKKKQKWNRTREYNRLKQARWVSRHRDHRNAWQVQRRNKLIASDPNYREKERMYAKLWRARKKAKDREFGLSALPVFTALPLLF